MWEKHHYFIDQTLFCFNMENLSGTSLHLSLFSFFSHMIMYTYNQWIIPPKSHKEKNSLYVCLSGQWITDNRYNGNNYILLRNLTQSPAQSFKTSELCRSKAVSARLGSSQENFRFVLLQGNVFPKCLLCVDKLFILNQAKIMNSLNRHWFLCF